MGNNSEEIRKFIYARDDGRCVYCGKRIRYEEMHLEHKIPKVFGGSNELSNLLCSCKECNLEKSSKLLLRTTDIIDVAENKRLKKLFTEVELIKDKAEMELLVNKAAIDVILNYNNNGEEAALSALERLRQIIEGEYR